MSATPASIPALRRVRRGPPLVPAVRSTTVPRATLVAAATRVLQRRGARGLLWSQIAREAGTRSLVLQRRFEDLAQLVYECHDRSAAALEACLLRAETSGGIGRDRLSLFLRAAFAVRRDQGAFLPLQRPQGLPAATAKGFHDREAGIRARLDRLLRRGQHDGSLAAADREAAVELVLGALYHPAAGRSALHRAELDASLAELLVRALAGDGVARAVSAPAPSAPPRR
jgi:AcrR family transcriptional regulator